MLYLKKTGKVLEVYKECVMWDRKNTYEPTYRFTITSDTYVVDITGGSVIIKDRKTGELIKRFKGYRYLYTGDISHDERKCFALENGKHFYVYSLETMEQIKRITLPRSYESIDMVGFYSDDGKIINIPVHRWKEFENIKKRGPYEVYGRYEYYMCRYETENYTLVERVPIKNPNEYRW